MSCYLMEACHLSRRHLLTCLIGVVPLCPASPTVRLPYGGSSLSDPSPTDLSSYWAGHLMSCWSLDGRMVIGWYDGHLMSCCHTGSSHLLFCNLMRVVTECPVILWGWSPNVLSSYGDGCLLTYCPVTTKWQSPNVL